ncbi:MAG TPA: proline racemase family protein [Luteolibacter sp.]|nr:proline racemase family protein [Luteolibacter sp.]
MKIIESHTIGEPTRIIIEGGPDLGKGPLAERCRLLREKHDAVRRAICHEPRGHDAMVGGLLCEPHEADCDFGIIFFNNRSTLGMCIHGTMGLVATLAHLGRLGAGRCRIDTPVGVVEAQLDAQGLITVTNVPCYRLQADMQVEVAGYGKVSGDIAWGGNWFFLMDAGALRLEPGQIPTLTQRATAVRHALQDAGITAPDGAEIDHMEFFGPPADDRSDSRNFVLCPGGAYDRSPCGTGLSAKIACLAARGQLAPGQLWRQASILNQVFEARYEALGDGRVLPSIRGRAWVNAETRLIMEATDPFAWGIA